jgi:TRAP-type C4-dicarboxylate transport system permease small subunit
MWRAKAVLQRIVDVLEKVLFFVSGMAMLASVGLAFAAVIMRYAFNFSLEWIEEGARYLALFAAFIVAGPVLRNKGHVALDLLVTGLTGARQQLHLFAVNLAAFIVGAAIFAWGAELALQTFEYGVLTASLQFPQWLPYSIVPLGMGILVLFSLSGMIAAIQLMRTPEPEQSDRP